MGRRRVDRIEVDLPSSVVAEMVGNRVNPFEPCEVFEQRIAWLRHEHAHRPGRTAA